jgi:predicted nuclease of predicted toxin-antitoxin system
VAGPGSGSAAQPPPALIVDLNLPPALVDRLAERGLQAVHWSRLGPLTARDEVILARARADGAVLVTHDLDFSAILAATGEDSPSVIQIRLQDLASNSVALVVEDLLAEHADSLRDGALVSVSESGARVRMLPLRRR